MRLGRFPSPLLVFFFWLHAQVKLPPFASLLSPLSLPRASTSTRHVSTSVHKKAQALNPDRRRNPDFPVQMSALAREEVARMVALFKQVRAHREELLPALRAKEERNREFNDTIQLMSDDLDEALEQKAEAEKLVSLQASECGGSRDK